jgi:Starch binding domain
MYRFQLSAHTKKGEYIGLVGSTPELGLWDITRCLRLRTNEDCYPLWWTDAAIDFQTPLNFGDRAKVEYKYVRFDINSKVQWEALGRNRWVPIETEDRASTIVVDDGAFGYLQPYPFGYIEEPAARVSVEGGTKGLKILVIGSSVALGYKAWLGLAVGTDFATKVRSPTRECVGSGCECKQNDRTIFVSRRA